MGLPTARIGRVAALAAATAVLSACGIGGTATVTVTCPAALVDLAEAAPEKRPERPVRGQDRLADLDVYAVDLGAYTTALARQAAAREEQVRECREAVD